MDKDVTVNVVAESAHDRERRSRLVRLLAVGVARLLAVESGAVKSDVDLSADVRVTTTTARAGGGDESWR